MVESIVSLVYTAIQFLVSLGPIGIFALMFLESSVLPIPSEIVFIGAGAVGFDPLIVTIFGSIASALGGMLGYYLGKRGGRFLIKKYGKYFFISGGLLKFVERWFARWGIYGILIGRLIPFVPFKVFSVAAGIGKMNFFHFSLFTLIGTVPRAYILSYFGSILSETGSLPLVILVIVFVAVIGFFVKSKSESKKK